MIDKPAASVTKDDIDALIQSGRAEDRRIDYKQQLPGGKDEDRKEFLADVSSFANASGGDILYGVTEASGLSTGAPGLAISDLDAVRIQLQNSIRDGIDPRIPSVEMHAISGFPHGQVILIRIHQSWLSPHMVRFKGQSRFYVRDAGQRHQMDVQELREAFLAGATIAQRIRAFRDDRLGRLLAGETPVPLLHHPTAVLHAMPLGTSFGQNALLDIRSIGDKCSKLVEKPQFYSPTSHANLDGVVIHPSEPYQTDKKNFVYYQIFRDGSIEMVETFSARESPAADFSGRLQESRFIDHVDSIRDFRSALNLEPRVLVAISFLRFRGIWIMSARPMIGLQRAYDRDTILLPDVVIDETTDIPRALRLPFDTMWQAAGFSGSPSFDPSGNWQRTREA